jgi:hypothetical protein
MVFIRVESFSQPFLFLVVTQINLTQNGRNFSRKGAKGAKGTRIKIFSGLSPKASEL